MIPRRAPGGPPLFVGVLHLLPLPGAPRAAVPLAEVERLAVADAQALREGGVDALLLENFGDAPFEADRVEPVTVAAMTRVAAAVRAAVPDLPLGLNVLRNDAIAACSIAAVTGADFVRVNVLIGAMVTDQGVISGRARELMQLRRRLGVDVGVAADVLVKHANPLGALPPSGLEDAARDTFHRGGADALVVTGSGTGQPTDPDHLRRVRAAVPEAPLWLGSGLTPETAARVREHLDAAIVGSFLHRGGLLHGPVDPHRVRAVAEALRR